ncbi:hypothetical protein HPP92_021524 [Vanilla planifolia]|uniref:CDP-diacylglycerol--serine O-phosphatidyltransferase n=1 Tax=Vanilla planifolia TaxID=51239 RepID=A0A835Q1Q6_VANPL|nr:hypothetical protein HPP92_021524 [Vanilla planifolia]
MSSGPGLESLVDQTISVITNDGRNIVGILKGFDQATNIILDESHERVYSTKEGVQQLVLGLYIIRGDNISVVGELDEELDANLDLSKLRAHPLKPVIQFAFAIRAAKMEVNGLKKAMKRDVVIFKDSDIKSMNDLGEFDPWTAWAYKPRTISLLLFGTCLIIWASGALNPESKASNDVVASVTRGIWAMITVFLAYSLLQAPSTVLIRPHPAIWRLVHGMAVVYLVALTFLLFQNRDDARKFMKFLHPDLGIGIWAGMHTVRYFDGKTYEWVGISRQPNIIGKVKRTLGQFTPARWDKDEWHPMLGPLRFVQVLSLCVVFMTVELNTFFLKFCLWIPPRNPLVIYRLILWWLIAIPTIREYNNYLQDRSPVKKVGAFCWLSLAICIVELLMCIKFGHGLFPHRMPPWLIVFWSSVASALVIFLSVWTWQIHRSDQADWPVRKLFLPVMEIRIPVHMSLLVFATSPVLLPIFPALPFIHRPS